MAFPKAQKDLEEALIRNLEGVKQKQAEIVKMWFDERKHDAKAVSKNISAVLGQSINEKVNNFLKLNDYIEMFRMEHGYKGVYITSREGTILAATERELIGSNIVSRDYCREALNGHVFISGIQRVARGESENKKGDAESPVMFISSPLMDSDNFIVGSVLLRMDTAPLSEIMKSAKLGKTGETFLTNREGFMLTESRFADSLRKEGIIQQRTALELRIVNPHTGKLTDGAQKCLSGKDGYSAEGYINYDGSKVLGAWCWIPEYDCGLVAQIDIHEGYRAAYSLKRFVLSVLLLLAFPLILVAFYFGKRISAPILNITDVTKKITSGDLGQRVNDSGKSDEISGLSRAFNVMAESLEEKTIKLTRYTTNLENIVRERTLELQSTTNFLNSILAGSTGYSIIAEDLNGNILAFNKGASLIYGYSPEEVVGNADVRILHIEEDVRSGKVDHILEETRRTGRYEGEMTGRRKHGEVFPVHVTFTLRRDESGQPIGFVVVSKDITKEKLVALEKEIVNIENARLFVSIRESEKKYRDLVENAPEMIHEISPERKFINVNKTELNKLGYSLEEMRQMMLEDIVPNDRREEIKRHFKRIIVTGSSELETVFLTKSGKEINVEIHGTALYNNKTGEC
ncbi:MAG: PAS domain S-box protein, partial [Candidatus Brocadiaceae bacterium]|nr:PAS domain S-box protein [Candidatus Brocadiaceae bacterium]